MSPRFARVAVAKLKCVIDQGNVDILSLPAKYMDMKTATDKFLMVGNALVQGDNKEDLPQEVVELHLEGVVQALEEEKKRSWCS